jgi:hypothetical protein
MKAKKKICSSCNQERYIWKNDKGNRYCKYCWSSHCVTDKQSKPTKLSKPIAHRSTKRAKQEREYLKIRRSLLLSSPACQAHLPNICTGQATDVHHMKGRIGPLLTDPEHFLLVCRSCHQWIELHPKEAKELGFSKTRI